MVICKKKIINERYANLIDDCCGCEYFVGYKKIENEHKKILCSGKMRIGCLKDFDIPLEKRIYEYDKKREEEIYDLISQGRCPQCGHDLKIKQGKYGEFFGCSNYPH